MTRRCERCGSILPHEGGRGCPKRPSRRNRPSRKGRPSRKKYNAVRHVDIWAIDTEEVEGKTVCIVAANEAGDSHRLVDAEGIGTINALEFLTHLPDGLKVSFAFNYDVTMLTRDVPFHLLNHLRRFNKVTAGDFQLRHIPGKRFWAKDDVEEESVQVWDVWSWWQRSFNKLLDDWDGLADADDRAFIRKMKALRDSFETVPLDTIVEYCTMECKLLAKWVRILLELHEGVDLHLRSYCGPGSTASAIYQKNGYKPNDHMPEINGTAMLAYYGGRNEVSSLGIIDGPIYAYDIGSAYPFEISILPAIHGWTFRRDIPKRDWWGFAAVKWKLPERTVWGPFPIRGARIAEQGRTMSLVYPTEGKGVYHSTEVMAALKAYGSEHFEVSAVWEADVSGRPFAWVEELAATRLKYKAEGDPLAYPLKVGLNALYGKMAQRSGKAPYRDVVYAAAVTAGTRARLLPVLAKLGHKALLAATDGILTTVKVPSLEIGDSLGQWELKTYPDACIAQSGVYWLGDKIRTRGFRRNTVTKAEVLRVWTNEGEGAEILYDERRFLGYRIATHRNRPDQIGKWIESERRLRLSPYPRRRSYRKKGHQLKTLPPTLESWEMSKMLDEVMLTKSDASFLFQRLATLEDPEWNLDDG